MSAMALPRQASSPRMQARAQAAAAAQAVRSGSGSGGGAISTTFPEAAMVTMAQAQGAPSTAQSGMHCVAVVTTTEVPVESSMGPPATVSLTSPVQQAHYRDCFHDPVVPALPPAGGCRGRWVWMEEEVTPDCQSFAYQAIPSVALAEHYVPTQVISPASVSTTTELLAAAAPAVLAEPYSHVSSPVSTELRTAMPSAQTGFYSPTKAEWQVASPASVSTAATTATASGDPPLLLGASASRSPRLAASPQRAASPTRLALPYSPGCTLSPQQTASYRCTAQAAPTTARCLDRLGSARGRPASVSLSQSSMSSTAVSRLASMNMPPRRQNSELTWCRPLSPRGVPSSSPSFSGHAIAPWCERQPSLPTIPRSDSECRRAPVNSAAFGGPTTMSYGQTASAMAPCAKATSSGLGMAEPPLSSLSWDDLRVRIEAIRTRQQAVFFGYAA